MGKRSYNGTQTSRAIKRKAPASKEQRTNYSPPAKKRTAGAPRTHSRDKKQIDDQPDLQLWLSQTDKEESRITPPDQIQVAAEIHAEPTTPITSPSHSLNNDPINIALGIAKDASAVKSDIIRVEQMIQNNRNTHESEHESLLFLLNTIHDNVHKIDENAKGLEEQVRVLSFRVNEHDDSLKSMQRDIQKLFNTVAQHPTYTTPHTTDTEMDHVDSNHSMPSNPNTSNPNTCSLVISNLPNRERDDDDLRALMYVGLCIPAEDIQINKIHRADSRLGKPGNITVELESLEQKILVLSRKRQLQYTNEYYDVYIRAYKSRNEIIMERNFSNILRTLPGGHNLMLASNGTIRRRQPGQYSGMHYREDINE